MLAAWLLAAALPATLPAGVDWRTFDDAAFAGAKATGRLVLLDVGTGWCHWCHVMDARTYGDPQVQALLATGFVVTRADADHRLDLAQRYGDWGWPATIVLDADGNELVKRKGFIAPAAFARMLAAVRADPTPGPSVAAPPPPVDADLEARWEAAWEPAHAGWGRVHKYIHAASLDLALDRAERGDAIQRARVRAVLEANRALHDPVEGGVFQYSDRTQEDAPWATPHYEKIMAFQASNLRHYARGARLLDQPELARAAAELARDLTTALSSPDGAFYASQDADVGGGVTGKTYYGLASLAARRALGTPRVDRSTYARETGQAAAALAEASGLLGDPALRARAQRAVAWARAERRRADGTYAHGADRAVPPYLGDTLAMAQAAWALYQATADRAELAEALRALEVVDATWRAADGGYATAPVPPGARGALARPVRDLDENVDLARLANLVAHASGSARARGVAEHARAFLLAPSTRALRRLPSGSLLVEAEHARAPVHVTVVGAKDDRAARALFDAARAWPSAYKRIEWLDRREGPLPRNEVEYPTLPLPAAFVCADGGCSSPVHDPAELGAAIARISGLRS